MGYMVIPVYRPQDFYIDIDKGSDVKSYVGLLLDIYV
jgi:hypothetical protein